ncbi:MAG: hypothetical protein EA397_05595 [Deltaproteobacteria bacterium]|nr:MAG: hypothetical protein EA397_05595 [Deltaproteobacteria bacterium]
MMARSFTERRPIGDVFGWWTMFVADGLPMRGFNRSDAGCAEQTRTKEARRRRRLTWAPRAVERPASNTVVALTSDLGDRSRCNFGPEADPTFVESRQHR